MIGNAAAIQPLAKFGDQVRIESGDEMVNETLVPVEAVLLLTRLVRYASGSF
jgi:hypothetical protein